MHTKKYNLFLDDERNPINCKYSMHMDIYEKEEWIVVRNFDEFYQIMRLNGVPQIVSFDYDLSDKYTGLDCAKFLKFFCEDLGIEVPMYYIHSAWPGISIKFDKILK